MPRPRRGWVGRCRLSVAALAALATGGSAMAHHLEHPKSIVLTADCDALTLEIDYNVQPGREARELRALWDRDGDGALSEQEQEKLLQVLIEQATFALRVELDGERLRVLAPEATQARGLAEPADSGRELGVALVLRVPLSLPPSGGVVSLHDRHKDPRHLTPVRWSLANALTARGPAEGRRSPGSSPTGSARLAAKGSLSWTIESAACEGR